MSPAHDTRRNTEGNSSGLRKIILEEVQNCIKELRKLEKIKLIWIATV